MVIVSILVLSAVRLVLVVVILVLICCVMSLISSLKTSMSIVGLDKLMIEHQSKGLSEDRISV